MSPPMPGSLARLSAATLTRLQLGAIAAGLLGMAALLAGAALYGEAYPFIAHRTGAYWITAPQPTARLKAIPLAVDAPALHVFERDLRLGAVPERAPLHVRALRDLRLFVNDTPVPLEGRDPRRWKEPTVVDVAPWLRSGANRLRLEVTHARGPALVQAWCDALGSEAGTSGRWRLTLGGRSGHAVVANDVRAYGRRDVLPRPGREIARRAPVLLFLFVLCALPVFAPRAWLRPLAGERATRAAWLAVLAVWLALFAVKASDLPLAVGYDAEGHVAFLDFLAEERRLPRADEGWEMFHPPLYYVAAAALRATVAPEPDTPLDRLLVRLLPMLAGLACAWLAGRTAARLLPGAPGSAAVAILAAGLLPMNLYMSVFASPESLHAALVGAALWLACRGLLEPRLSPSTQAGVSLALAGALLAKSTVALPVVAIVAAVLAFKAWALEAASPARTAGVLGGVLLGPIGLAGWFYVRNALLFGDPFISNLDLHEAWTYWVPPGFHTGAWFLGFGEVLSHPYFASFHSFGDGLYATFWGDGGGSGRAGIQIPSRFWDYEAMAPVYWLALPASGVFVLGFGRGLVEALRGADLGRRLAWSLLLACVGGLFFMLVLLTLRLPYYPMPKAFYALPSVVPLAVLFAAGVTTLGRWLRGRVPRAVLSGSLGLLAVWIVVAFLA